MSIRSIPLALRSAHAHAAPTRIPRAAFTQRIALSQRTARRWASSVNPSTSRPGPIKEGGSGKEEPEFDESGKRIKKSNVMTEFHVDLFESMGQRIERETKMLEHHDMLQRATSKNKQFGMFVACLLTAGIGYYYGQWVPAVPTTTSTVPIEDTVPPKHNISEANLEAAYVDFQALVGKDNCSLTKSELESHAGSAWSTHQLSPNDLPFCIVKPGSTAEVSAMMRICHERKIPVTAYSGGTSLEGHFACTRGGICVDFERMDKIIQLNEGDLDVVVQPAVGWEHLNEELAKSNLFFPPDPGPGAMIGGMIGTGCSGTNSYRYGTMKDWVINLTVVMADGTVIKTRQRPRKSSAGYDLTRMFVGSEGTLGLVTEATLKLTVKPQATSVAVCAFGSVRQAAECVFKVVGAGVPIAAIEILDDVQMQCINDAGTTAKTWKAAPTLFFKFAGTPASVAEQIKQVQALAKKEGSVSFEFARSEQDKTELWQARKEALWSVMAKGKGDPDMAVWTTDVAVPISRLPDIIEETQKSIKDSGLIGSIVGHVGDGNFHSILLYNRTTQHALAESLVHKMVKRAIEMEGTATGEHGVGLVKRDYLPHELGTETVDAMRRLKLAFDPLCILNCDKIVRVEAPKRGEVADW